MFGFRWYLKISFSLFYGKYLNLFYKDEEMSLRCGKTWWWV